MREGVVGYISRPLTGAQRVNGLLAVNRKQKEKIWHTNYLLFLIQKKRWSRYIDEMTMEIHHDKHHAAYVTNVNKAIAGKADLEGKTVEQLISHLDAGPGGHPLGAVRNNGGGHANHSMFWKLMGPKAGGTPTGALADDIKATFGSFDAFKEKIRGGRRGAVRKRMGLAGGEWRQAGDRFHGQSGQSDHGQGRGGLRGQAGAGAATSAEHAAYYSENTRTSGRII